MEEQTAIEITSDFIKNQNEEFWSNQKIGSFAGKQVFLQENVSKPDYTLYQIFGNLGCMVMTVDLDTETEYVLIYDKEASDLESGIKSLLIQDVEKRMNKKGKHYKHLKIITVKRFIEYAEKRSIDIGDNVTLSLINKFKEANN
jgi:hypothetical protein